MKIPVIALAQPNRMAKLSGRFLGHYDIAWSGAAENSAAWLVALQKANAMDMEDEAFPTFDDDHWYEITWKSRDGYPIQVGPGAIIRTKGKQLWRGTPYMNQYKLWTPYATKSSIKRKKREEA